MIWSALGNRQRSKASWDELLVKAYGNRGTRRGCRSKAKQVRGPRKLSNGGQSVSEGQLPATLRFAVGCGPEVPTDEVKLSARVIIKLDVAASVFALAAQLKLFW